MTKLSEIVRESGPALVMVLAGVCVFVLAYVRRIIRKRQCQKCQIIKKIEELDEAVTKEREAINMLKLGVEQLKRPKR